MRSRLLDAVGLAARLLLGSVLFVAGWLKLTDLTGSLRFVAPDETAYLPGIRRDLGLPWPEAGSQPDRIPWPRWTP